MKRRLYVLAAVAAMCLCLLAGCSAAGDKLSDSPSNMAPNYSAGDRGNEMYGDKYYGSDVDMENGSSVSGGLSADLTGSSDANRKIIERTEMSVQTKTYDALMSALSARLKTVGGYVESARENASGQRYANIVVRVPADKTADFQAALTENGTVTDSYTTTEDVTLSYVDIESRIAALEAEQTALLAMLEKAQEIKDLLDIQSRVTEVTAQLESYQSRLRTYDSLIAYSTVTLNIYEVERVEIVEDLTVWEEIGQTLSNNLEDIGDGFVSFFIWFVGTLPYLLLFAIPVCVVLFIIIRRCRRRRKARRQADTE